MTMIARMPATIGPRERFVGAGLEGWGTPPGCGEAPYPDHGVEGGPAGGPAGGVTGGPDGQLRLPPTRYGVAGGMDAAG